MFNNLFLQIPDIVTPDKWHPDGLYGLKPAYELLIGQFGVGLLASFLPALMLRREFKQLYSIMYKAGVLVGIVAVIAIASIVLHNFSDALEQTRSSALTITADSLKASLSSATNLVQEMHRMSLLIEYQIVDSFPSSLPLPDWLKALGVSRLLLLAMEFYSLLQPVLGTPKMPDVLRRIIKAD